MCWQQIVRLLSESSRKAVEHARNVLAMLSQCLRRLISGHFRAVDP